MVGGHSAADDPEQQAKLDAIQYVYLLRRPNDLLRIVMEEGPQVLAG